MTLALIQDSGGTAGGGDDTAALSIASAVTVTAVNDEPSLTATAAIRRSRRTARRWRCTAAR